MPSEEELIEQELAQRERDKKPGPLPIKEEAEGHIQTLKTQHQQMQEAAVSVPAKVLLGFKELTEKHPRTVKILEQCLSSGEPFIVFRAKDIFTPMVMANYLKLIEDIQPGDSEQQEALVHHRDEIVAWQRANTNRVRYPD